MSGTSRWFIRRTAGAVGALVALMLVAAPAALASGDVITAAANVNFNGVVDAGPQCDDATSILIHWGDGTTTTGSYRSDFEVRGNHTFTATGSFSGTIAFSGASDCTPGTPDTFTANVAPTPQFPQCPQVGVDIGCQFLIDITPGGTQVLQDGTQGPYEQSEDALIGVKNDSSAPLASIPISTPGSDVFGFDADGLCDNGAGPVPTDCKQIGAPAGTPCDPSFGPCATPATPSQPNANPDPYTGSTQNGYEGPRTYFSNVSASLDAGTVHFDPPLQPGQSTYFSLEEPPSAAAINVGTLPTGGSFSSPPAVTATSASFVAIVNPNGSATNAQFQFSLDPRYGSLVDAAKTTPLQAVGGDFANHVVTATVTGLVPNAIYHVHLVATNRNGATNGPDVIFQTSQLPAPGAPVLGRSFNLKAVSGLVLVKVGGAFVPLTQLRQFPTNTIIDALGGTVQLITAGGPAGARDAAAKGGKKGKKGKGKGKAAKTQSGTFGGAIFKVAQAHSGLATLSLVEGAFTGAPTYATCKAGKAVDANAAALSAKTLQLLHANAKGKFSTSGKYGAATVRGTKWTIADKCNGTLVHDVTDSVAVKDFKRHKTIILHAGQSYLAKK